MPTSPGIRKFAVSTLIAASLAGCGREIGTNFDAAKVSELVPGKSTLPEAVALLGPATRSTKALGGDTVIKWRYIKDRPGGTDSAVMVLRFDSAGKLVEVVRNWDTRTE